MSIEIERHALFFSSLFLQKQYLPFNDDPILHSTYYQLYTSNFPFCVLKIPVFLFQLASVTEYLLRRYIGGNLYDPRSTFCPFDESFRDIKNTTVHFEVFSQLPCQLITLLGDTTAAQLSCILFFTWGGGHCLCNHCRMQFKSSKQQCQANGYDRLVDGILTSLLLTLDLCLFRHLQILCVWIGGMVDGSLYQCQNVKQDSIKIS